MDIYSIYRNGKTKKQRKRYSRYTSILSTRHPRLRQLISLIGPLHQEVPIWSSINDAVLYAVIGQMLSAAAAGCIIKSLIEKFGSSDNVIKWASKNSHIKGPICGVSHRKRKAFAEWASYLGRSDMAYKQWSNLPLNEVRAQILDIWGFGPWSADMIAIFHLGKMNVWPVSDVGIKRACSVIFGGTDAREAESIIKGCETVAAIYMWELLNRKLVADMAKR